ncbi:MAG TPA: class D sortase [Candidatus Dormibacteraeota bacterium]|nr:class D sortase [Candidatus Dormibacteraeota bacterium]
MTIHLPIVGRTKVRPAARGRRPAALLLAVGTLAVMTGIAIVGSSLEPMFGSRNDTAMVVDPAQPSVNAARGELNALSAPGQIDRPVNGIDFTMRIRTLGYSANVVEGVDSKDLALGPGHYPTTAWPGRYGTVGVAAHNVYWLSFSQLKAGDRVELQTSYGLFLYAITGSKITGPDDVAVLRSTSEHRLTLTTCYPLWAGAFATRRLVFFAREIGVG